MITPVEVLGKELRRGFGYKAVEVDEFLEELAKDYEKVYKENNELREKVSALTENLSHYRTIEESLKRALVLAEETSKETCLLYTSPSPRDRQKSRMPSSA